VPVLDLNGRRILYLGGRRVALKKGSSAESVGEKGQFSLIATKFRNRANQIPQGKPAGFIGATRLELWRSARSVRKSLI